jgi:hypothetical protein
VPNFAPRLTERFYAERPFEVLKFPPCVLSVAFNYASMIWSPISFKTERPDTKSRWAQLARSGKKVMQFLVEGRYVANVADGKVTLYGKSAA